MGRVIERKCIPDSSIQFTQMIGKSTKGVPTEDDFSRMGRILIFLAENRPKADLRQKKINFFKRERLQKTSNATVIDWAKSYP